MIHSSPQAKLQSISQFTLPFHLGKALNKFWQFSILYGEYVSLPPSKRRKFLNRVDSADATSLDRIQK